VKYLKKIFLFFSICLANSQFTMYVMNGLNYSILTVLYIRYSKSPVNFLVEPRILSHYQHRYIHMMTDGIDRCSENKIAEAMMAVSADDEQIGFKFFHRFRYGFLGIAVTDFYVTCKSFFFQLITIFLEILCITSRFKILDVAAHH